MKRAGRVLIYVTKKICGGKKCDSFFLTVAAKDVDSVIKKYKSMGYEVVK